MGERDPVKIGQKGSVQKQKKKIIAIIIYVDRKRCDKMNRSFSNITISVRLFYHAFRIGVIARLSKKKDFSASQYRLCKFSFVQEDGTTSRGNLADLIVRRHQVHYLYILTFSYIYSCICIPRP